MATYRQIQTSFWQDGFVLDLTPEEKYFYIYLMTNSKTSQCGIYELPKRIIETETGYNRETVDKLLQRFIDYGKILYDKDTREIMIINWLKYNTIKSPKVISCIEKELKALKNKDFIRLFLKLCKEYEYSIDTLSIDYGEEEEKEQEEEKEEEQEQQQEEKEDTVCGSSCPDDYAEAFMYFEKAGFGTLSDRYKEFIMSDIDLYGLEWFKEAIDIAIKRGKYNLSYVEGVLNNWKTKGKNLANKSRKVNTPVGTMSESVAEALELAKKYENMDEGDVL